MSNAIKAFRITYGFNEQRVTWARTQLEADLHAHNKFCNVHSVEFLRTEKAA